jgi:hypothetical protein
MDLRNHSLYLFLTRSWALLQERSKHRDSAVPAGFNRMAASALSEGTYWAVEGRRLEVCLDPPSASMEKKWHQALGYLDRIVNECRTHRTPVAFLLIPDEFQVDAAVLEKASEARGARAEELDLDLPQRRLRRFCTERRVPCLDLKTYFERENKTYAPHDTHWNEKGNRLAASWMAPWLRQLIEDRGIEDRGWQTRKTNRDANEKRPSQHSLLALHSGTRASQKRQTDATNPPSLQAIHAKKSGTPSNLSSASSRRRPTL